MSFSTSRAHEFSILHIEDSDADAKLIQINLKKASNHDNKLYRARDTEEALRYLEGNHVDLILLDLYLPDSEGLDTLKRVKTHSPKNAIVVITGTDDEATALQAVKNGAQDYLVKDELTPRSMARSIRYSIERHRYDQRVIELANIDMLTGLPNRARFMEFLTQAIETTERLKHNLALLFIDCDHFKIVNDTYGHVKGDEFLIHIANCLKGVIRSSDFVARLAGDEFVIALQTKNQVLRSPLTVAEKILFNLNQGIRFGNGERLDARCSIGITSYGGNGEKPTPDKLIHEADTAMYLSKTRGGNCASFFDQELEEKAERRIRLLRNINYAFRKGEFFLNYQPIYSPGEKFPVGLEALLRWKSSAGEYVSPAEFIPLLEENGLIQAIGDWVIKKACNDFLSLRDTRYLDEKAWLSINISPVQLQAKNFAKKFATSLRESHMLPELLHLEITESLLMEKHEHTLAMLHEIKDLGCKWAIDDFGVGYSSMSYLKNLPISLLKIDKSFVENCSNARQDLAITRAMIALAHNLNMKVVAEGVETNKIAEVLNNESCDFLQGYLFSKPLSISGLKNHLEEKRHKVKRQHRL